ncbi:MAG: hypothetical protein GY796_10740 [Chloroflexi bacterium]|nr:hypothetical protein [Chloroflexota bacterium]
MQRAAALTLLWEKCVAPVQLQNVDVIIGHPFGDIRISLESWIDTGPGARMFIKPIKALKHDTSEGLSLNIIPLQYRNDVESIEAILGGKIADPWNHDKDKLKELLGYRK